MSKEGGISKQGPFQGKVSSDEGLPGTSFGASSKVDKIRNDGACQALQSDNQSLLEMKTKQQQVRIEKHFQAMMQCVAELQPQVEELSALGMAMKERLNRIKDYVDNQDEVDVETVDDIWEQCQLIEEEIMMTSDTQMDWSAVFDELNSDNDR